MRVAESTVIFGPICQVGCRSASAGVTSARLALVRPRNGPPDAVRISRRTSRGIVSAQALMDGVVLAVHRQDRHAASAGAVHHQPAGHHQHFLVGQGDGLAGVDGRQHRLEGRRARRRAEHEVDLGMGGDGDQAFGADAGHRRQAADGGAQLRQRVGRRHRHRHGAVALQGGRHRLDVLAGGQPDDPDAIGMRVGDRQRTRADGPGGAENRDPDHVSVTRR